MTSNMIYIVALGVGLKCPRKIHLNTQCGVGGCKCLSNFWRNRSIPVSSKNLALIFITCAPNFSALPPALTVALHLTRNEMT